MGTSVFVPFLFTELSWPTGPREYYILPFCSFVVVARVHERGSGEPMGDSAGGGHCGNLPGVVCSYYSYTDRAVGTRRRFNLTV